MKEQNYDFFTSPQIDFTLGVSGIYILTVEFYYVQNIRKFI